MRPAIGWLVGFADNVDMMIDKINLVAGPNFFSFARLNLPVNTDQAVSDGLFGITATITQTLEFEYFVKFDEFGFELCNDIV